MTKVTIFAKLGLKILISQVCDRRRLTEDKAHRSEVEKKFCKVGLSPWELKT